MIIGTRDISTANMTDGRRPPMIPRTGEGTFDNQERKENFTRYEMFEIRPTKATGIAQNTTKAVMKPRTPILLTTRCHHEIFKAFQTTSLGFTPINRGDI